MDLYSKLHGELNLPSPLQRLESDLWLERNIELFIKRDDLIHPDISGNKWRKLKYNLLKVKKAGSCGVATVGGAFSNHLVATSKAASLLGIPSLGYVKSHDLDEDNPSLGACRANGMQLELVSRDASDEWLTQKAEAKGFEFVPEGGSNLIGVKGMSELLEELPVELTWDYVFTSIGSGGTIAGLVNGFQSSTQLCGISSFSTERIEGLLEHRFGLLPDRYMHFDQYRLGGFGKYHPLLIEFADHFFMAHQIVLDPIYTAKTMYGLYDLISSGWILAGSRILFIHTGGIQGWRGFTHRFSDRPLPSFLRPT